MDHWNMGDVDEMSARIGAALAERRMAGPPCIRAGELWALVEGAIGEDAAALVASSYHWLGTHGGMLSAARTTPAAATQSAEIALALRERLVDLGFWGWAAHVDEDAAGERRGG